MWLSVKALNLSLKGVETLKPKFYSNGVVSAYVIGTSLGCIRISSLCKSKV